MSQLLRDSCVDALKAFGEGCASEKHLGREFELYQKLRGNPTHSSHQEYIVPMIAFYVNITHLVRCAAIYSILCLKGVVHKDCVRLIVRHVYNSRFDVKIRSK